MPPSIAPDPGSHRHESRVPRLEARAVSKSFGPTRALIDAELRLFPGEIHALMGENGAGKSTLIKCITGVITPDRAELVLDGARVQPRGVRHAESLGISTVQQEVGLIPRMTIAENICLGREPVVRGLGAIRWKLVRERARAAIARLGLELDVDTPVAHCPIAIQQLLAIARALDMRARVLILDEPTSSLDKAEASALLGAMRRLRDDGMAILFVSHFLEQVEDVADRVTVLRNGAVAGESVMRELSRISLVSMMVGRELSPPAREQGPSATRAQAGRAEAPRLRVSGLHHPGVIDRVSFDLAPAECLGLVGLLGAGRTETAMMIFGLIPPQRGEVAIDGAPGRIDSPRTASRLGLALTPENRKTQGLFLSLSVRDNLVIAVASRRGLFRRLSRRQADAITDESITALGIKCQSADAPISSLSGGNQQKVMLARWLATEPRILILDEPTRGIDIGAKEDVLCAVERVRARGAGVILITSELTEIERACGRAVVLRDRASIGELPREHLGEHDILGAIAQATAAPGAPGQRESAS